MHFKALDSWRGICALIVAAFHFPILGVLKGSPLVEHAYLFVDFFFVLSGFVIGRNYEQRLQEPGQVWQFVVRRFGRLWPLHVALLAVFVAVSILRGSLGDDERHSVGAIFSNLTMIHGLGIHEDLTWNDPSWSISVEFLLYLLFAALSLAPRRTTIYLGLIAGSLGILIFWAPQGMASTFDFGLYRGLAGFFSGVLIARLPIQERGALTELMTTAAIVAFVSVGKLQFLAPFVFAAAVLVFSGSTGPIAKLLSAAAPVKLGEWSYSIYMTHTVFVAVIWAIAPMLGLGRRGAHLTANTTTELTIFAGYLIAVIGVSFLTYTCLESPARNLFNRMARGKRLAAA
ncbi:MAG TPA: acyltransferase [Phenylobacterium sp.]